MNVKQLVLGNARIIYGSEARKFFGISCHARSRRPTDGPTDFVTGRDPEGKYVCVLVCSLDGHTRILRKETHTDALGAARALADSLIKDTGALFSKLGLNKPTL